MKTKNVLIWFLLAQLVPSGVQAQGGASVYRVDPKVDGAIILGTGALTYISIQQASRQAALDEESVLALSTSSVSSFDRIALHLNLNEQQNALDRSDLLLRVSMAAPVLLGLDKRVRQEWKPLVAMYVESMLVNCSVQGWTSNNAGRFRPITYVPEAAMDLRTDPANRNSFFSGHTSTVATSTFFMAKVMNDLHPELGGKRWLLYGAAAVPTALTGYYRVKAAKHFPSDVLVGASFGALVGVLIPELHKRRLPGGLSVVPFANDEAVGMVMGVQW